MRVLILGAAGMLGHKLWQALRSRCDAWGTVRSGYGEYARYGLFDPERVLGGVDALDLDSVIRAFATARPDAAINCIGIIKQVPAAKDPVIALSVNSLFPHRLASLCQAASVRLIHISTDCVFSGRKGMYREEDASDAEDLYGRSKFLGEVAGPGCLTLRTSIVGRELRAGRGLVEWFLSNEGRTVRGFARAIYSGFTTIALARVIGEVLEHHPQLSGVYHVSSDPINKCELLCLLREAFGASIEIEPCADIAIDRSLDSSEFRRLTGFMPRPWSEMIREMADDPSPYQAWRKTSGP